MPPWLCAGGDVTAGSRLGSGEEFPFILDFLLETLPPSLQGCQGRAEQPETGTGQTVRDDGDGAQPQALELLTLVQRKPCWCRILLPTRAPPDCLGVPEYGAAAVAMEVSLFFEVSL